jgi:nucleotide-binding universal stress UspA family protein
MEFHKILVPVDGTGADEFSIKLACRFARGERAKILVVHVISIDRSLPLDTELSAEVKKAEDVLERAEKIGIERGCNVETDLLQARNIGASIVDEAVEQKSDLIVMGMTYKRHFGQYSLGYVTPYILKNAPCPVMLFQQTQSGVKL